MNNVQSRAASDRLREARLSAGFRSMAAFAEQAGVEAATYRNHENGSRGFDAGDARRYAAHLNVSWLWLLHGDFDFKDEEAAIFPGRRLEIVGLAETDRWTEERDEETPPEPKAQRFPLQPMPGYPADAQYAIEARAGAELAVREGGIAICVSIHAWPGGDDPRSLHGRIVHVERHHPSGFVENSLRRVEAPRGSPVRLAPLSQDPRYNRPVILGQQKSETTEIRGVAVAKFEAL